jgi:hypothetical protein
MVIAVLIVLLFALDLIPWGFAPFQGANWVMDVVFVICGGILGYLSWATLQEQI